MTKLSVFSPLLAVGLAAAPLFGGEVSPEPSRSELVERLERLERELDLQRRALSIERGARRFAGACAACHGREGRGDGPGAADLDPAPRDLSARQIRFRSTPSGRAPRPEDLERTIRSGLPGTAMPAFGNLFSNRELSDLIGFIYSLRPDAEETLSPPTAIPLRVPTTADASTIEEGRALYLLTGCWRCHGVDGSGNGPSAATLVDESERPIRTTDLRFDPFKGGRDASAIVRTLVTGLNGSPMPAYDEAMLIAREDAGDLPASDELEGKDRERLDVFVASAPSRAALEALPGDRRSELRDRRLAALAHYVLSLDRRRGARHWLLREEPEREARRP